MSAPKVDVLAVMDAACCVLAISHEADPERQLAAARAAVAELIAAGKAMPTFSTMHECDCETCTAIVRFNAALANIGGAK